MSAPQTTVTWAALPHEECGRTRTLCPTCERVLRSQQRIREALAALAHPKKVRKAAPMKQTGGDRAIDQPHARYLAAMGEPRLVGGVYGSTTWQCGCVTTPGAYLQGDYGNVRRDYCVPCERHRRAMMGREEDAAMVA